MSTFKCPHCGSENIQKCEVIYMNGTTNISATTTAGDVEAQTSGQISTSLAQSVAPPAQKEEHWIAFIVCGLIALWSGYSCWSSYHSQGINWLFPIFFALVSFGCYTGSKEAHEYNTNQYPREYQAWKKSYICHRCGSVFQMK